jgi:hypothetical protein
MSNSLIGKDNNAWTGALRGAIAARDEPLYRRKLMQFLDTREGFSFAEELIRRPAALAVMRRSFRVLAAELGLTHPNELVAWLRDDETTPREAKAGARDAVSTALPYLRFARGWARAARKDSSYAIALALTFFEPVLPLCEAPTKASAPRPRGEASPKLVHLTERT